MRASNLLHLYSIIYTVSAQSPYKQKTIEVLENTPVDTDLFNLNQFYSDGIKRRFSVQQTKNTLIAVDDLGNVKLSSHVDYESLCSSNPCTIDQTVSLTSGLFLSPEVISVHWHKSARGQPLTLISPSK